jgi:hypothetical protein
MHEFNASIKYRQLKNVAPPTANGKKLFYVPKVKIQPFVGVKFAAGVDLAYWCQSEHHVPVVYICAWCSIDDSLCR